MKAILRALLLIGILSCTSQANLRRFDFEGRVVENAANSGLFGANAQIDDLFSGYFVFDDGPSNVDQSASSTEGEYDLASFVIDQSTTPIDPFIVEVYRDPTQGNSEFLALGYFGNSLVQFQMVDSISQPFADTSLPSNLELSDFELTAIRYFSPDQTRQDLGVVTKLSTGPQGEGGPSSGAVPEPASMLVWLGMATFGLSLWWRSQTGAQMINGRSETRRRSSRQLN